MSYNRQQISDALLKIINHGWKADRKHNLLKTFSPVIDFRDPSAMLAPIPHVEFRFIAGPVGSATPRREYRRCTFDMLLQTDKTPEEVENDRDTEPIIACVLSLGRMGRLPIDGCRVVSVNHLHESYSYHPKVLAMRQPGRYASTYSATFRLILQLTREVID